MFATGEQAWVQEVFGGCQLDDARRTKRLVDRGARLARQADASMAKCCNGDSAAHLGRYRFLRNNAVSAEQIAEGGFGTAIRQVDKSQRLLALEEWRVL